MNEFLSPVHFSPSDCQPEAPCCPCRASGLVQQPFHPGAGSLLWHAGHGNSIHLWAWALPLPVRGALGDQVRASARSAEFREFPVEPGITEISSMVCSADRKSVVSGKHVD